MTTSTPWQVLESLKESFFHLGILNNKKRQAAKSQVANANTQKETGVLECLRLVLHLFLS